MLREDNFLLELKQVAKQQRQLDDYRLIPKSLSPLADLVALYTWQSILVLSLVSTVILRYIL